MTQYHFDPSSYLAMMREDMPRYDELQEAVAAATAGLDARRILELGTGTGETARRLLTAHPGASLVGIDASEAMLDVARAELAGDFRAQRLEHALPRGPFDLVVSAWPFTTWTRMRSTTSSAESGPRWLPVDASYSRISSFRNGPRTS